MSFFLDPPALLALGMLLYYVARRQRWEWRRVLAVGASVSIIFIGASCLLYLDVVDWPLPSTGGPEWMFHTEYTGIQAAEVPPILVVAMFLLYPLWHALGYLTALRMDSGSFLLPLVSRGAVRSRRETEEPRVVVRRGPSPKLIVREAVEALGGMTEYVKTGDRVLIKPNICGGNPQTPGSYTSIEVVDEIVRMVKECGGEPVVADSDMIWTEFKPVAEAQGWKEWADREGVRLVNLAETEMRRFNFGLRSAIGVAPVSREMLDADVIISAPTMKTHLLTSVTLAMKNMYGTLPEKNKAKYHRLGIENVVCDVNRAFRPNLVVIDGTIGGEAWGPLSCSPVGFETVVASNDVVAADSVACALMGYDPMEIVHVRRAHEKGLGRIVGYDLGTLPYSNEKDGEWMKPDPKVSTFYESLIEAALLMPGMQAFFDAAADHVLYGTATISLLKERTPEVERALNDVIAGLIRSGEAGTKLDEEGIHRLQDRITNEEETP
ncbi:MAG TPA: DUF362 domain-containing protein [Patescibacteria group bacterium]|nr:DUF362 domain-containing protein [Patescibacteria group bacterium]